MRYASLLAASAIAALHTVGDVIVETVASDYDRAPAPPAKPAAQDPDSLRVRLARLDRERKDRRRAEAAAKADAGRDFVHRRNRDAI